MMRSAVIEAPRHVGLARTVLPQPGGGQVRVRLRGCGICASNLPLWQGRTWFDYPQPPGAPGHEGWGVIDEVGEGVTEWKNGDTVAFLSQRAYAEFDLADTNGLVRIPAECGEQPLPGEPLGCAMNIFRRSAIETGQNVAILGAGFLGALLVQLCARAGARVIAVSRREFSRRVALQLGAAEAVPWSDDPADAVRKLTDGAGCARVIECVGNQRALDLATRTTAVRGRLVIAAFHQDGPRRIDVQQWNWNGIDVINAHERDPAAYVEGMRAAVDGVASGWLSPGMLLTHPLPLHELSRGFELMEARPDGFIKAYIDFDL